MSHIASKFAFTFICCFAGNERLNKHLLASPCLAEGSPHQLLLFSGMSSVAEALRQGLGQAINPWVVLVHDDVFLPEGWDSQCRQQLAEATRRNGRQPSVAGVFGSMAGQRCGNVLDRGLSLCLGQDFPCKVDALDELLLILPTDTSLVAVDGLGFHLYGTDLALQAQQMGGDVVVIDAPCEHWSELPSNVHDVRVETIAAIDQSVRCFKSRWLARLPLYTPCFLIGEDGWAPY